MPQQAMLMVLLIFAAQMAMLLRRAETDHQAVVELLRRTEAGTHGAPPALLSVPAAAAVHSSGTYASPFAASAATESFAALPEPTDGASVAAPLATAFALARSSPLPPAVAADAAAGVRAAATAVDRAAATASVRSGGPVQRQQQRLAEQFHRARSEPPPHASSPPPPPPATPPPVSAATTEAVTTVGEGEGVEFGAALEAVKEPPAVRLNVSTSHAAPPPPQPARRDDDAPITWGAEEEEEAAAVYDGAPDDGAPADGHGRDDDRAPRSPGYAALLNASQGRDGVARVLTHAAHVQCPPPVAKQPLGDGKADNPYTFTLVTVASPERLWMLPHVCARWEGPLVVALFVTPASLRVGGVARARATRALRRRRRGGGGGGVARARETRALRRRWRGRGGRATREAAYRVRVSSSSRSRGRRVAREEDTAGILRDSRVLSLLLILTQKETTRSTRARARRDPSRTHDARDALHGRATPHAVLEPHRAPPPPRCSLGRRSRSRFTTKARTRAAAARTLGCDRSSCRGSSRALVRRRVAAATTRPRRRPTATTTPQGGSRTALSSSRRRRRAGTAR